MSQVDRTEGLVGNTGIKAPVRLATTANITLSGEQTIDGVAAVTGDRILVKNQTTGSENGIYDVSTGTWSRSQDFDGAYDCAQGTLCRVYAGNTNIGIWELTTSSPVIGTSSLTFAAAAGSGGTFNSASFSGTSTFTGTVVINNQEVTNALLAGYGLAIQEHGTMTTTEDFSFSTNYHTCTAQAGALSITFSDVKIGSTPYMLSSMLMYMANGGLATITWNSTAGIYWQKSDGSGDQTISTTCPTTLHSSGPDYLVFWAVNDGVTTTIAGKVVR